MPSGVYHRAGKKGRNQVALIGAVGPSVTPICLNSNGVNPIHGLFVLSESNRCVYVAGGPNVPIRVAWLRPFFPHDDKHPMPSITARPLKGVGGGHLLSVVDAESG
ncbi:hypothetical protein Y032_0039g155 [Ancylostoma ceylanicum]|uniref:Uncharacterized protein n=1 Tax=Ancylostoma ceylanicum TaxID=53326 RepID=A0A016UHD8_9BILA|nr:hypothetical protein Y032_0039g155 [Ancylostoma ceylanicum]